MGPVRHRSRLLHQVGLRRRLIAVAMAHNTTDRFDVEVHMKAAQVTNRPLAVDRRRRFLGLSGLVAAVAWPQDASTSRPPRISQGAAATYPVNYHRTKTVAHPVQCCFIGLIGVATMLVAGGILPFSRSIAEILFVEWLPGSRLKLTPGTKAMGVIAGRWARTFAFAAFSVIGSANYFGTPALAQVQRSGEPSEVSQPNLTGDWGGCGLISSAMASLLRSTIPTTFWRMSMAESELEPSDSEFFSRRSTSI